MSKRAFERSDGVLVYRTRSADGNPHTATIASSMLGEPIGPELRAVLLERVASGIEGLSDEAVYALIDTTPEFLDALLLAIDRGGRMAAWAIVPFADDPRVRPAILRAVETATEAGLGNVVQTIGRLRIEGALERLEKRLAAIEANPETFESAPHFGRLVGAAFTLARALLQLDPGHLPAARALARLCAHPSAFYRQCAVNAVVESLTDPVSPDARRVMLDALTPFATGDDAIAFLNAAPALIASDAPLVKARLERLLRDDDANIRSRALTQLQRCAKFDPTWADEQKLQRVQSENAPSTALMAVSGVRGAAPARRVAAILRHGLASESPVDRVDAIRSLGEVSRKLARQLARTALVDEPDPALRKMLESHCGPHGGPAKPSAPERSEAAPSTSPGGARRRSRTRTASR